MSKINKQFEELTLSFQEDIYDNVDDDMKEVYKEQRSDLENMLVKIAKVVLTYTVIDNVLNLDMFDKKKLKKDFNRDIYDNVKKQYQSEKAIMLEILTKSTIDKYDSNSYIMSLGVDFKLNKLTNKQIVDIVNSKIDEKVWSSRLYTNKKSLERDLKKEVSRLLNGETDINKIEKLVKNKYNQNAYNSKRLINTEVAKCQSEVNDIFAKENGIEQQMFIATLDNRTSTICESYDSKIFDTDDPIKPVPPLHSSCRSVLVNMPSKNWQSSIRKDNITKEYVNYSTYEEWKQNQ